MDGIWLQELLRLGESETVEFKKSTGLMKEIIETICAFANTHGGDVLIGVQDDDAVVGQQISDDTLKQVANDIKLNTEPKLYPTVQKAMLDNRAALLVSIEESPLKPHLAYGRPFVRVGATNQRVDREMYAYMLEQRHNGYGFDYQPMPAVSMGMRSKAPSRARVDQAVALPETEVSSSSPSASS